MKLLKKYFNRENKFSLKESFNIVMALISCFFMGVIRENEKLMQEIREMIGGQAVGVKEWLMNCNSWKPDVYGEGRLCGNWLLKSVWESFRVIADGQVLAEKAGLRGKRGNRIRDVSYANGLPCIMRSVCRGSP